MRINFACFLGEEREKISRAERRAEYCTDHCLAHSQSKKLSSFKDLGRMQRKRQGDPKLKSSKLNGEELRLCRV